MKRAKGLSGDDIFSVGAEIYHLFMNILEGQGEKKIRTHEIFDLH